MMTNPRSGVPPGAVLLCQPTSGGKSITRDAFAACQGGVTWSISPLLALGADQESKINTNAKQLDNQKIVAIHLFAPKNVSMLGWKEDLRIRTQAWTSHPC